MEEFTNYGKTFFTIRITSLGLSDQEKQLCYAYCVKSLGLSLYLFQRSYWIINAKTCFIPHNEQSLSLNYSAKSAKLTMNTIILWLWLEIFATCLGLNCANSTYFCPWCIVPRHDQGDLSKDWKTTKDMENLKKKILLMKIWPVVFPYSVDALDLHTIHQYEDMHPLVSILYKMVETDIENEIDMISIFWQDKESKKKMEMRV